MPRTPIDRVAASAGRERRPGTRAMQTRERISACVRQLIEEVPYRELTTALVSQRLGLSPGAFYRYFADINDAILDLTPAMRATADDIAELVRSSDWGGDGAEVAASSVVDAMAGFWRTHRALYRVTDLRADEGDERFARVKATTFTNVTEALRDVIAAQRSSGRHAAEVDAFAAACVAVAMLIHTMARERGFGLAGVAPPVLRAEVERVLLLTVTGRA